MAGYFESTVTALVSELAAMPDGQEVEFSPPYSDVSAFVFVQMKGMPWFLSCGVRAATCLFGASGWWREGSFFFNRQPPQRKRQIEMWRESRLGVCRNLMKFYSAMVAMALYSRPARTLAEESCEAR